MSAFVTNYYYVRRGLRSSLRYFSSLEPRQDFTCFHNQSPAGRGSDRNNISQKRWLVTHRLGRMHHVSPDINQSYNRVVGDILKGKKFQNIQSSLELQGLWSKDICHSFRNWLLSKCTLKTTHMDWGHKIEGWLTQNEHTRQSFIEMLSLQRHLFQKHLLASWKIHEGLSPNEFPTSFFPVTQMVFSELADQCTKYPTIALVIWNKTKESGVHLDESTSKSLLKSIYSMGKIEISNENNEQLINELAMYHEFLHGKNEITVSIQALHLLSQDSGNTEMAEQLLRIFDLHHDRNVTPPIESKSIISNAFYYVLKDYCQSSNLDGAISLLRRLKRRGGPKPSLEMHILVISCLAANNCLRQDTKYLRVLNEILFSISMKVSKVDSDFAMRLYNILQIKSNSQLRSSINEPEKSSDLTEIKSTEQIPLLSQNEDPNTILAGRVMLDTSTGMCSTTNINLELLRLNEAERNDLYNEILRLSGDLYEQSPEYKRPDNAERASNELKKFVDWLHQNNKRQKYTAIVDGANVGFYMRKFANGKFSHRQIQAVVSSLEASGERPLVILPYKYSRPGFIIDGRFRQYLDKEEMQILESLRGKGQLFQVPPRCQDDLYCVVALLFDTEESQEHCPTLELAKHPYLVTNDRLRDHSFKLRSTSLFRRLCRCHSVRYRFNQFSSNKGCIEVEFLAADLFNSKIQVNACPSTGLSSQSSINKSGKVWHFPVKGWPANERLVIKIPDIL